MKQHNLWLIAGTLLVLSACGGAGGGSGDPVPSSSASAPSGGNPTTPVATKGIIDNEDMSAGLKGIDANNNGIRDDIDRLIAQKYSATPALKKAAEQTARSSQLLMLATNKNQVLIAVDEIRRSGACVDKVLPENTVANEKLMLALVNEISALTANTEERFKAHWAASGLAGGSVFRQPKEPVCD